MQKQIYYKTNQNGLVALIASLISEKYTVIGPTLQNKCIVYDEIQNIADLPQGFTDKQEKGFYRTEKRKDNAYFGYNLGPRSWKNYLFPAKHKLATYHKKNNKITVEKNNTPAKKYAFFGIRSCEIEAIKIQDKIFINKNYPDNFYKNTREQALIIAINCTQSANTCFCTSMQTGPFVKNNYDLSLTEVIFNNQHYFTLKAATDAGLNILQKISAFMTEAKNEEINIAKKLVQNTADNMLRSLNTHNIKELLYNNHDHPNWDNIANRCLSCTNCTMVCPTCFCQTTTEEISLDGKTATTARTWDSCFNLDHSYLHGGSIRQSTKSRYRQWLTHKFASWQDQFDTSGCVGCGRCIAWCPVGIDVTEELSVFQKGSLNKNDKNK